MLEIARKRNDAAYELVDIKEFELPLLDEPDVALSDQRFRELTESTYDCRNSARTAGR
jgi:hypothetical protein